MIIDPLVSIIIPLFNAEIFITETLDSVHKQTYKNLECIIIDDGSTDSSEKIVKEYCKRDIRFKYYYQENSGPSAARNYGLELSQGDYIQFLDADDVLFPDRLEVLIAEYQKAEPQTILYSNLLLGDADDINKTTNMNLPAGIGHDIEFDDMYRSFALDFIFIPSCVLFPRKSLKECKWNNELHHSEDWDLYLDILSKKYRFRIIDSYQMIYRNTPGGLSKETEKTIIANYQILAKWMVFRNRLYYIKRNALMLNKSVMSSLLKRTHVNFPIINLKRGAFNIVFYLCIYPLTAIYLIISFFVAFKKI